MLREKDPMIAQLRDVALQTAGARAQTLRARRLEEQEDLIYRVREVGWSYSTNITLSLPIFVSAVMWVFVTWIVTRLFTSTLLAIFICYTWQ